MILPLEQDIFAGVQNLRGFVLFSQEVQVVWEKSDDVEADVSDSIPLALKSRQVQFEGFDRIISYELEDICAVVRICYPSNLVFLRK